MSTERNRPGPQTRCGVCPECGEDYMRQYGAKHNHTIHRYYYACQARECQFTGVWREVDGGVKFWEKNSRGRKTPA